MKAATIILALAGAVMAQNFDGQPACATDCLISAISAAGCAPSDVACQCGPTQTIIGASAAPCLLDKCQPTDLIKAQSAGAAQCSKFSATATKTEEGGSTETTAPTSGATITNPPTTTGTGTVTPQTTTSGNAAAGTPIAMGLAALLGAVAAL
ncbi:hypothetical protein V8F20_000167 [Naviculisporaceae sp. PSN 640]